MRFLRLEHWLNYSLLAAMLWLMPVAGRLARAQTAMPPDFGTTTSDEEDDGQWHFQYDLFQLLLEERGLKAVVNPSEALVKPNESLIVVATASSYGGSLSAAAMLQFVERGGAVLLARELSLLRTSQASVSLELGKFEKGPVFTTSAADQYREFADCLSITGLNDPDGLLAGVRSIITNRSGWHTPPRDSSLAWQVLARFPQTSSPPASRGGALLSLARTKSDRNGVLVVSADASLFSNGMLWHGDNAMLAVRVAELVSRDRKQLLFLADGTTQESAIDRLAQQLQDESAAANAQIKPPEPSLKRLLRLSNAVVKEVGNSGLINETLKNQPRSVSPRRYFNFLLIVAIVASLLWILWKLARASSLRTIFMPRRRMRPAFEMMPGSSGGDYRNSAGYLAREFCSQWTGSRQSSDWQQSMALLLVHVTKIDETDKRDLSRIVDIACRGCHERMTAESFRKFGQMIARLRGKQDTFRIA